jgi:fructan beta-fructosidase
MRHLGSVAFVLVALLLLSTLAHAADDILIADFEGDDYGAWKTTGEAFGPGPARGTLAGQMSVSGFLGKGLVNSFFHGDDTTGKLTSPAFTVNRPYLNFLIGGGKSPGKTCINLLVNGQAVRTATGPNDQPGGTEALDWCSWDVQDLAGKEAVLEIVDEATGGWGHINIDQITLSDRKMELGPAERKLVIEHRYLHLPVKNGAAKRRMRFELGGRTLREFDIELAEREPDFWVFADVRPFQGQTLTIAVNRLPSDHPGLAAIVQADEVPGAAELYREKHRPQFHFSSRRGWNNDPNGLVWYQGEFHLYYQHNPYGWAWGNMHWGHAVSPDLVHWTELPIALYPQRYDDWCFSGGAILDRENTAGFKTGSEDVIVAAYTSTGRGESIAYSNDRGRTFTDYPGNPVLTHQGRDPKLIWYAPGKHWVMAVYDEKGESKAIAFYTSTDLKQWEFQSRIESFFECPELFELAVDGDPAKTRWVAYAADGNYVVGQFDGKRFTVESGKHQGNYGNCFYASQTFSDVPPHDGRRIQIGWGQAATPGMPFNQMMTFPCELTLRTTEEGIRMFAEPVREIEKLHGPKQAWSDRLLQPGENLLAGTNGDLFDLRAEFEPGEAQEFGFVLRGIPVVCNLKDQKLSCRDRSAPLKPDGGKIRLQILLDRTSIEIFANGGRVYMPIAVIPADDNRQLEIFCKGGPVKLRTLEVFPLQSAWQ